MKISEIQLIFVKIPVIPLSEGGIAPYRGHDRPKGQGLSNALSCIFKVSTDEGIIGWGETNPIINLGVTRSIFEVYIKPLLIGKDPIGINSVIAQAGKKFEPPIDIKGILTGIEVACWDITGKAAHQPVYNLLGGKVRNQIQIAYCLGLEDLDVTKERIAAIKAEGFSTLKTTGGSDLNFDIKRAEFIRDCCGDDFNFRVDMNEAYDFAQATKYFAAVEHLGLEYVEQPIRVNQFEALAALRRRSKTPIAINEDCYIPHNLFEYILQDAIDVAVVDLDPSGGISELVKIADFSEEAGLPLVHHCGFDLGIKLAAILQVTSSKQAFSMAIDSTYMTHRDDILSEKIKIKNGCYVTPDKPGLGVDVDEDKIRFYKIDV